MLPRHGLVDEELVGSQEGHDLGPALTWDLQGTSTWEFLNIRGYLGIYIKIYVYINIYIYVYIRAFIIIEVHDTTARLGIHLHKT